MKKHNGMFQNAMILFIAMTLSKIIGAVLKIPLGNILGGLGMSYFSAAYSVFSPVYALTTAALPTVITKLVAQNVAAGKIKNIRKIKKLALQISLLLGFFGTVAILVITAPFAVYVANSPKSIPAMLMIAPSLFFCCISAVYRGYYEGLCNMIPTALSQIIEAVVKAIFGIILSYYTLLYTESLPFAAAAAVLGITLSEFLGMLFLLLRSKFLGDGFTYEDIAESKAGETAWQLLKRVYKEMLPITVAALVINLSSFIDLLTITNSINYSIINNKSYYLENFTYGLSKNININDLGNFIYGSYSGIVSSLFGLVASMTAMVSRSALPNIAASFETYNKTGLRRNIRIIFKGTFAVGFPLSFGMAAMSEPILTLLYSSKPDEVLICIKPLFILSLFGMALSLSGTLFNIFLAIGRADLVIKLMLLGCIFKFGGNILLIRIPELNITGAAISTVSCYLLICAVAFRSLGRIAGYKLGILPDFVKYSFCAAICGASAYLLYYYVLVNCGRIEKLTLSLLISCCVYFISVFIANYNLVCDLFKKRLKGKEC